MPEKIQKRLESLEREEYFEELLRDSGPLHSVNTRFLNYYKSEKLAVLREALQILPNLEEEEKQKQLSCLWIEYRKEWIRLNAVINFSVIVMGRNRIVEEICASYISYLIGIIEEFMQKEQIEDLERILLSLQTNL